MFIFGRWGCQTPHNPNANNPNANNPNANNPNTNNPNTNNPNANNPNTNNPNTNNPNANNPNTNNPNKVLPRARTQHNTSVLEEISYLYSCKEHTDKKTRFAVYRIHALLGLLGL